MNDFFFIEVETGYWVPGAPGPLVWGDMAGQLKLKKMKKDFLKFLNSRKTRRSTRQVSENVSQEIKCDFKRSLMILM